MRPLLFSLLLLSVLPLRAEVDRAQRPEAGPAPEAGFPDYTERTLPNGLKVFVIEDERKPTLTLRLLVKSGSVFDGPKSGLASLVANLLPRGTTTKTAAVFAQETDFIGAKMEAVAGPDSVAVTISGLTKYTEQILGLFAEAVLRPAFAPEQLSRAQRQTLSQLAAEKQEPSTLSDKLSGKVLYRDHPYGAYQTEATVRSITREDLVAFHQKHFLPNNASLAIVGDVKAAEILPRLEAAFGGWAKGERPELQAQALPALTGVTVHLLNRPGSVQSNIVVQEPGPPRNGPDLPELNVLNATLGGGFSGRLFQNLRERHGWTYGAYSAFDPRRLGGSFEASAETRNEVTGQAVAEMLKEMGRLREEAVPEAELQLQRQYNVGNYLLSLENAGKTATRVQDIDLYGLPTDFYKHYARRMGTTSAEQVQALARKYLHPEQVAIVVVGEAKQVGEELKKFGPVYLYDTDLKLVEGAKGGM